ncbi:MAG TPA: hypothetical protein VFO34_14595 [Candidatus Acidoferrales bacterium]|nr:hypothetical protein [Candidatus Acidoferrales bacterium]
MHWKRWGPYVSNREWGTVREDYSSSGTAWDYFPHEHARSRAYRWGEDGIAGLCDDNQRICIALAMWNGRDPILKERMFGLTANEGNHGEDVKEYYFFLDSTPTHSYMKFLYKYPQTEFPYARLVAENRKRSRTEPEFDLSDSGVFDENRYFDVVVEYAKASADDILIRITASNRGPDTAGLVLLPTLWFRNRWAWGRDSDLARVLRAQLPQDAGVVAIELEEQMYGKRWLFAEGRPELLFTENETNFEKLFGVTNAKPHVKDAFHDYVIERKDGAVNPAETGTKSAALYRLDLSAGATSTIRLRFTDKLPQSPSMLGLFGDEFDSIFKSRKSEADEFYAVCNQSRRNLSDDARNVMRQAFSGLLWNKQFYHYDVHTWLQGDPAQPPPPAERLNGRNHRWPTLFTHDVMSMPDNWEFPWFAAWDLAFHTIPLAMVDPDYAKEQLILLMREWYMHPNGQFPAYEWGFSDVNPPVHAWAAWRVYKIEGRVRGRLDREFLVRAFHKLLLNFTWWVNRKDPEGMNVFEGGFLGLDNIGVFDRSAPLPIGGHLEQSDGTSWVAMYCLNMLAMAIELAKHDIAYEDVATKFFEHFVYISEAMNNRGGAGMALWDDEDGFYYDVLHLPDSTRHFMKVRSMVGLIPLLAVETLEPEAIKRLTGFRARMQWFIQNKPAFCEYMDTSSTSDGAQRILLSLVNRDRLPRVLRYMLDENEFLSPHGIRSISKYHKFHPYVLKLDGIERRVGYEPAESQSGMFGGNSNWRGPVWMPMNYLLVEALQKFHWYYKDSLQVEYPTGAAQKTNLWQIAAELSHRLTRLFQRQPDGTRAGMAKLARFQNDPHWRDLILFHEYFDGDNGAGLGASHQTGWTSLVAKLLEQNGE